MKNAIKLAIEGGWRVPTNVTRSQKMVISVNGEEPSEVHILWGSEIATDPLFWSSLGKALGWYNHKLRGSKGECLECGAPQCEIEWHANWHRFIDHLASGGSVDEFFNDILK